MMDDVLKEASAPGLSDAEDLADVVSKAIRRAWQLGQTYWQQADSEYISQNRKSDATQAAYQALVDETRIAILTRASAATVFDPAEKVAPIFNPDEKIVPEFNPAATVGEASEAPHPDDEAVDRFAAAMKQKLAQARDKGRGGWQQCDPVELSLMLREHVEKGDPRDVANFCMFLWNLGKPISAATVGVAKGA